MGQPGPDNFITIPPNAKRYPITIPANPNTNAVTLLSLITTAGWTAEGDGAIVGYQIEANQPGVSTARGDFFIANAATGAAVTAHGVYVASGVAYKSYAPGEMNPVGTTPALGIVSATAGAVSAVITLYLTVPG